MLRLQRGLLLEAQQSTNETTISANQYTDHYSMGGEDISDEVQQQQQQLVENLDTIRATQAGAMEMLEEKEETTGDDTTTASNVLDQFPDEDPLLALSPPEPAG